MSIKVKPYEFSGKQSKKKVFTKKRVRVLLFALAGALVLAAASVFLIQWNEGEAAGEKAEALLNEIGMQPSASADPFPTASGVYDQPEEPDVQNGEDIAGILETELKGYTVIARLDIERLGLQLPVLSKWSDKALKVSVCYYKGPAPGEDGNLVITGHNYRSGAHFGKLDQLKAGDTLTLTGVKGNTFNYKVYKTELIKPDNPEALDKTKYVNELTLITCEANGNRRLLVRCALADLLD